MYVQFSIKIFHKLIPVIVVTIIRVPYDKNTINRQLYIIVWSNHLTSQFSVVDFMVIVNCLFMLLQTVKCTNTLTYTCSV